MLFGNALMWGMFCRLLSARSVEAHSRWISRWVNSVAVSSTRSSMIWRQDSAGRRCCTPALEPTRTRCAGVSSERFMESWVCRFYWRPSWPDLLCTSRGSRRFSSRLRDLSSSSPLCHSSVSPLPLLFSNFSFIDTCFTPLLSSMKQTSWSIAERWSETTVSSWWASITLRRTLCNRKWQGLLKPIRHCFLTNVADCEG